MNKNVYLCESRTTQSATEQKDTTAVMCVKRENETN